MDKILETIRIAIRDLLRERNLSQTELAESLGKTRQSINKIFAVDALPNLATIIEFSKGLKVEPFVLLMSPQDRTKWNQLKAGKCDESSVYLDAIRNLNSRIQDLEERLSNQKKPSERLKDPDKR